MSSRSNVGRRALVTGGAGLIGSHVTDLLVGEGWTVNHKKIQRLWRDEGLRVPQRRRRKRLGSSTTPPPPKADANRVAEAIAPAAAALKPNSSRMAVSAKA